LPAADPAQGVGRVRVHVLGPVDDDDAPPALTRRAAEELRDLPHLVDDDLAPHALGLLVGAALDRHQPGMRAGGDAAEDRIGRIDVQAFARHAAGEQPAGEAIGERGFADPLAAGDQPGMVQAAAGAGIGPYALGRLMAEQAGIGPGLKARQLAPSNWMSNISVAPGGMTPPAPWSP
jgi:hypothetical protein